MSWRRPKDRNIEYRILKERWFAVPKIVDKHAAKRSERDTRLAAANIRYYLSATTCRGSPS